jgi:hypothetical protein
MRSNQKENAMWQSFKAKVSDHSEEIVAGAVVVGTVVIYGAICTFAYKAYKQDYELKKSQQQLFQNAIELQVRQLTNEN